MFMRSTKYINWTVIMGIISFLLVNVVFTQAFAQRKEFEGVKLDVMVSSGHTQFDVMWDRLKEFEEETGMKITLDKTPYAEITTKALRDCTLGAGRISVMEIPCGGEIPLAPYMVTLNDYIEEKISLEEWKADYSPKLLKALVFDGKVKYYGHYAGGTFIAYRKDLFNDLAEQAAFRKEYGYELGPPRTLDQLRDIGKFFTRDTDGNGKTDFWGTIMHGSWDAGAILFEEILYNHGLGWYDENGYCMWGPQHPENQKLVEEIAMYDQNLYTNWKITPPGIAGTTQTEAIDFYLDGRAAILVGGPYFLWSMFENPKVIERIGPSGTCILPGEKYPPENTGVVSLWMIGINSALSEREISAAWRFVQWAWGEEGTKYMLKNATGLFCPPRKSLAEWARKEGLLPVGLVNAVTMGVYYNNPQLLHMEVRQMVLKEWQKMIFGEMTPEEFVKISGLEADRILKEK